MDVERMNNRM